MSGTWIVGVGKAKTTRIMTMGTAMAVTRTRFTARIRIMARATVMEDGDAGRPAYPKNHRQTRTLATSPARSAMSPAGTA